jgi:hypothetical protein
MPKFTRRDFIKASVATGIVAGAVAAPAVFGPFRRSVLACPFSRMRTATASCQFAA